MVGIIKGSVSLDKVVVAVIPFLMLILALSLSVNAATSGIMYVNVHGPNSYVSPNLNTATVTCSTYGDTSITGTWGSYQDCRNRCNAGQGTYYFHYGITPVLSCGSNVPNTGIDRQGSAVNFCIQSSGSSCVRNDNYCDCAPPLTPTLSSLTNWYNGNFQTTASYNDLHRVYQIQFNTNGAGWTALQNCPNTNPGSTSCSATYDVKVGSGQVCSTSGANACTVRARGYDYWNQPSNIGSKAYNIDLKAPTSIISFSSPVAYNDGTYNWYKGNANYAITCNDNGLSGCKTIYTQSLSPGSTACPSTGGTYTGAPASGDPVTKSYSSSCNGQKCDLKICYYSEDKAISQASTTGNIGAPKASQRFMIDSVAPTTSINSPDSKWKGSGFPFTLKCDDTSGSGCNTIYYQNNQNTNDTSCPSVGSFSSSDNVAGSPSVGIVTSPSHNAGCPSGTTCKFSVCYYSSDNVGNTPATPNSTVYGIDKTKPTVMPFIYSPVRKDANADNKWENSDFRATITVNDTGSGIAKCEYRILDNGNPTAWTDAGCPSQSNSLANSATDSSSFTVPVTVGQGKDCSTNGIDTCEIQTRITDNVGNVNNTYSEKTSIDYIPPKPCTIINITEDSPYSYYNASTKSLIYSTNQANAKGNFTVYVADYDNTSKTSGVSGPFKFTFPLTTSAGGTKTRLPVNPPQELWNSSWKYNFNQGDSFNSTVNVVVADQAGNTNKCSFTVRLYNEYPKLPSGAIAYNHQVWAHDHDQLDFNINFNLDHVVGINNATIYERYATGSMDNTNWEPTCRNDWQPNNLPLANMSPGSYSYTLKDNSSANFLQNGECYQFRFDVCNNVGNCNSTSYGSNIYAQAKSFGNDCRVFGAFDNCNNRANTLAGQPVTQPNGQQAGYCPGSCVGGKVTISDGTGGSSPVDNSQVSIVGFETKPGYSVNTGNTGTGDYALFNITDNDRPQTIRADPPPDKMSLYNPISQELYIPGPNNSMNDWMASYPAVKSLDLALGFASSTCTDSCTRTIDTVPTCYSQCNIAGNMCAKNSDGSANATYQDVLTLCSGKPKDFIVSYNDTYDVQCCTGLNQNGQFVLLKKQDQKVTLNVSASNVVKSTRVVYFNGKLVKLVVALFR